MSIIKPGMVKSEPGCTVATGPTPFPELGFGVCRFCEAAGQHQNMTTDQVFTGAPENYFDMLLECFNVFLAADSTSSSLICASCASRLRDARDFKQLVLRAHSRQRAATLEMEGFKVILHNRPINTIKLEAEVPPEPYPAHTSGDHVTKVTEMTEVTEVVVKSEPDMDIVEHVLIPRPDQNPHACCPESAEKKFLEEYYKSTQHEEEDSLDTLFEIPHQDYTHLDPETNFLTKGCGCQLSCSDKFNKDEVIQSRLDCLEQDYYCYQNINHLNLMMYGAINATTKIPMKNEGKEKKSRTRGAYWFRGTGVCKKFYLFVHGLTDAKLAKIIKSLRETGFESLSKNCKQAVMTKQQREDAMAFINNFSEQNSLVLPGRSPNNTDLHILPSSISRTFLYERYVRACKSNDSYPLSRPMWYRCWENHCPDVTVSGPSNPCVTCGNFVTELSKSQTEDDKKKFLEDVIDHLHNVQMQKGFYRGIIAQASLVINNMSLGEHAACSFEGLAHYSFDYFQQIHLPHNPDKTGPQDFLNNYKVSLFAVAIEPLNNFVLYVIPELIPTGINLAISLLHHFFEKFALGETHVVCHSTNRIKDDTLIQYAASRVLSGSHESFQLSYLPSGHAKFALDVFFGLFKSKFRESEAYSLENICDIAVNAGDWDSVNCVIVANTAGESYVNNYDWKQLFKTCYPSSVPDIHLYNHFKTESGNPGVVICSKIPNDSTNSVRIFASRADLKTSNIIEPRQLPYKRQIYLYSNIRQYVPVEFQDILCPAPNGLEEDLVDITEDNSNESNSKDKTDSAGNMNLMDDNDIDDQDEHSDGESDSKGLQTGHKNEIKQGVYVCEKRLKDSKVAKKCDYCVSDAYDSILDVKLKEVYMENCTCKSNPSEHSDPLGLLKTVDDQVTVKVIKAIPTGPRKKRPMCSYCGQIGHRNQARNGIYFCKKRRKDLVAEDRVNVDT